ncbi:MAG: DUF134 domain-containing protein [bacterium]
MPRPQKCRWISSHPGVTFFKPQGIPLRMLNQVHLGMDELEAIRLADLESLSHEQAAQRMNISRATFGRILAHGRKKVADALIQGKAIRIEGGTVELRPPITPPHWQRGPHGHGKGPCR